MPKILKLRQSGKNWPNLVTPTTKCLRLEELRENIEWSFMGNDRSKQNGISDTEAFLR